jgi:type IV pilus assembly protein PilB
VGVYEMLELSEATRELVMKRASSPEIAARAKADGKLSLLREDGFVKVAAGVTSIGEVLGAVSG